MKVKLSGMHMLRWIGKYVECAYPPVIVQFSKITGEHAWNCTWKDCAHLPLCVCAHIRFGQCEWRFWEALLTIVAHVLKGYDYAANLKEINWYGNNIIHLI